MLRNFIILLLCLPLSITAQEESRVVVKGVITAPAGADVEGINIYNISSEQGTISDENGRFNLRVAENDRIQITALQFQNFTLVIRPEDVRTKQLLVYLNPYVNKLGEVILRNTDLIGIVESDIRSIKTSVFDPDWDLSRDAVEFGYDFERDRYTGLDGNAAMEALNHDLMPMAQVNISWLVDALFPRKKRSPKEIAYANTMGANTLLEQFDQSYLAKTFGIPQEKVVDFVYFAQENGLSSSMLDKDNRIELLQYLYDQSELYKKLLAIN